MPASDAAAFWTPATGCGTLSPVHRLAALLIVAFGMVACSEPPVAPNLLLITLDTTRADALGAYGNAGGHTPTLDGLAARGVVFDRTITPIGTTFPAHASIFTGLYPTRHGVRSNDGRLKPRYATLAEILHASGYDTAAWVSFESMLSRGGLRQGFEVGSAADTGRARGTPQTGAQVNEAATAWLRLPREKPFFAWLHYFEAHSPYRLTPYARSQLGAYTGSLRDGASVFEFYALNKRPEVPEDERRFLRALYDGEIREADRLVGEVLTVLRERGLLDTTIVVVTADHGQSIGEHGRFGHGGLVTQPVIHVPLIIAGPGLPEGRRIAARVGLVDLAPTLLDLLGVPAPAGIDGRSVLTAIHGEPLPPRRYFAEVRAQARGSKRSDETLAIYDGDRKSVWTTQGLQTFDLAADPDESHPLPSPNGAARDVETLAAGYYAQPRPPRPARMRPSVEAELRALGYVE